MSIFFILFFLLHLSTSQLDDCTSAPCSKHGPTIRFPFRLKDNQPPHCGFPGFDLSCSPNTAATLLNLPYSVQVIVTNIDYKSQLIHIKGSNSCLLNLSTTPFQFEIPCTTLVYSVALQRYRLSLLKDRGGRLRPLASVAMAKKFMSSLVA
ncbi:hypothetical protein C3L33_22835, partial [Rhododendron williamsianum]